MEEQLKKLMGDNYADAMFIIASLQAQNEQLRNIIIQKENTIEELNNKIKDQETKNNAVQIDSPIT